MTNSVSWQDELNLALWLATRAGGAILPARDTGYIRQGKFILFWCFIPYNKSLIDQACSVKMAGYWPRSFFCVFMDLDFVSVHKHAKKNLANIQPSWPNKLGQ